MRTGYSSHRGLLDVNATTIKCTERNNYSNMSSMIQLEITPLAAPHFAAHYLTSGPNSGFVVESGVPQLFAGS